jgi:RimJ/RimL family protein N-acetyltransferase
VGGAGRSAAERVFANLPKLETGRLLLRKMRLDDAEAMFAYASDPRSRSQLLQGGSA